MKTISAKRSLIESFKRVQVLPLLANDAAPAGACELKPGLTAPAHPQNIASLEYVPTRPVSRPDYYKAVAACLASAVALSINLSGTSRPLTAMNGWVG
jgi:hypothetical protein